MSYYTSKVNALILKVWSQKDLVIRLKSRDSLEKKYVEYEWEDSVRWQLSLCETNSHAGFTRKIRVIVPASKVPHN